MCENKKRRKYNNMLHRHKSRARLGGIRLSMCEHIIPASDIPENVPETSSLLHRPYAHNIHFLSERNLCMLSDCVFNTECGCK